MNLFKQTQFSELLSVSSFGLVPILKCVVAMVQVCDWAHMRTGMMHKVQTHGHSTFLGSVVCVHYSP